MSIGEVAATGAAEVARAYVLPRAAAQAVEEKPKKSRGFGDIEDQVEISPEGRQASLLAENLFGVAPRADGNIHLEDLQAHLAEISADLQGAVGSRFRAAGIDTSQPIDLEVDSEGNIRVTNGHPDKEKIEQLFADDPELANDFRGALALQELVSAAEKHVEFSEAYDADPEAAVAQFGVGSNGIEADVLLRFVSDQLLAVEKRQS